MVIDEIHMAYQTRKQIINIDETTQKNINLGPKTISIEIEKKISNGNSIMDIVKFTEIWTEMKPFHQLLDSEKIAYDKYYEGNMIRNTWLLEIMARESSVQLILQNALVMYEVLYPSIDELDFNSFPYPSARWMVGIGLQLFSIVLSAYGTFNPILVDMTYNANIERKPVGLLHYVITVLQVTCHIAISAGIVFLVIGHKNLISRIFILSTWFIRYQGELRYQGTFHQTDLASVVMSDYTCVLLGVLK